MNKEAVEEMYKTLAVGRPKVVCICGSTKFKEHHMGAAQRETLCGHVVLTHGFYHHIDKLPISTAQKARLDELLLYKIDMSDEVLVINVNGYVGESTHRAVDYARVHGKPIRWLEDPEKADAATA